MAANSTYKVNPSEDYEPLFELVTIEDVLSYTYQAGWFDGDGWIEGDLA